MALIMGKIAELAARRLMSAFIISRLGPARAYTKLTSLGYMIPRSQFGELYQFARDENRTMAKILSLGENQIVPKSLQTPTSLQTGRKYMYSVEFDIYDKSGKFYKSSGYGVATDAALSRSHAEYIGFEKATDYWSDEKGWTVKNPRLVRVMTSETSRR